MDRACRNNRIRPYLCLGLSGLLTSLTLIVPKIGFLEWFSLIPAFLGLWLLQRRETRSGWRYVLGGLSFFLPYYLLSFHWFFYMYPLEFTELSAPAAFLTVLFCWIGLSLIQTAGGCILFYLLGRLGEWLLDRKKLVWLWPVLSGALFVLFEWHQTLFWWGVPWGRLCLGQAEYLPVLQSASWFGCYFITFLLVVCNAFLAMFCRKFREEKKAPYLCLFLALGLFTGNAVFGMLRMEFSATGSETVRIAAVQSNIPPDEKWDTVSLKSVKKKTMDMTAEAADRGAKLIVWSETAIPYNVEGGVFPREELKLLAKEKQVTILATGFTDVGGKAMNIMVVFHPDGTLSENTYAKQRLVPFGEYVPMKEILVPLFPFLRELGMLDQEMIPGQTSAVLSTEYGVVGPMICFDSLYENIARESALNGAEIFVVSSNDAWFKDSAACALHNAQTRLRAIENGRFVLHAANTGISCLVDEKGREIESLGALKEGLVEGDIAFIGGRTVYSCIGNLFVILCGVFAGAGAVGTVVFHGKKHRKQEGKEG